jgi:hypothetical protein
VDTAPGRLRRTAIHGVVAVALSAVFTISALGGAALHMGMPVARRLERSALDALLRPRFRGEIRLGRITRVALSGVTIDAIEAIDPGGRRVLDLERVEARFDALALAWRALRGGEVDLTVDSLAVRDVDVDVGRGPGGGLALAETFEARSPGDASSSSGRRLRFTLRRLRVGSIAAHGTIAPGRTIDASARDLQASVTLGEGAVTIEPVTFVERGLLPVPIAGVAGARLVRRDGRISIAGELSGQVGEVKLSARGALDDRELHATVEVPELRPQALHALVPEAPLARPVALRVELAGALPVLEAEIRITEAGAPERAIEVHATIDVAAPRAAIDLRARHVDPRLFVAEAPPASLDGRARGSIELVQDGARVAFDVHLDRFAMAGRAAPALDAHLRYAAGILEAIADIHEPGVPLSVWIRAVPAERRARFRVTGDVASIRAAPRLAGPLDGRARFSVTGAIQGGRLDAAIDADLALTPGTAPLGLAHGALAGRAFGPLGALAVDLRLHGQGLRAGGHLLGAIEARVQGTIERLLVRAIVADRGRTFTASATVDAPARSVREARVSFASGGETALATIERVAWGGGAVRIEAFTLGGPGLGRASGAVAVGAGAVEGWARAEALDVGRLIRLAGLPIPASGLVSLDTSFARGRGRLALELEHGAYGDLRGIAARADVRAGDGAVVAEGIAHLAPGPGDRPLAVTFSASAGVDPAALLGDRRRLGDAPFTVHGVLARTPIAAIAASFPWMAGRLPDVAGDASVEVFVAGTARDPRAVVIASGRRLGPARGERRTLDAYAWALYAGALPEASAHGFVRGDDGGTLRADASIGIRWAPGEGPVIDPDRAVVATVEARRFRLAAVQPFVDGALSRLDGLLDGRLALAWERAGRTLGASAQGELRLSRGVLEIPGASALLTDARLRLVADPGVLRLEEFAATSGGGSLRGSARVELQAGRPMRASAQLEVPEGSAFPVTVEGSPLGRAYGRVALAAEDRPDAIEVTVSAPSLHLELPRATGRSVQSLAPDPDIEVLQPIGPPEPTAPTAPRKPIAIAVDLGEARVESRGLALVLSGVEGAPLRVNLADQVRAEGELRVRGTIEILGNVFRIQQGVVHLRPEEPDNPNVRVEAAWDAPDGTRVVVDYSGALQPITRDKIRFRSSPPRPEREIIGLILFGSEGASGRGALRLGAALASAELGALVSGVTPLQGFDVKVGTTEGGALATSIGHAIGAEATATLTYRGAGASGGAGTELAIEWRFHRSLVLRAFVELGARAATSLDLLWTRRY